MREECFKKQMMAVDDDDLCRVGKCHGYDGYIRVKKFGSWGKKFGRSK